MLFRWLLVFVAFIPLHAALRYEQPWGKDADLTVPSSLPHPKHPSLAVAFANQIILFHQNVISPVDGPRSHYRPSSSQYMQQAMQKHGFIQGFIMGCDRLLRENKDPWVYRSIEYEGKLYKYDPPR